MKKVSIVVLGDVGRSPRMCYHALSFAKEGYLVDLFGYNESSPSKAVLSHDSIKMRYIPKFPDSLYMPRLLLYFLKVSWQAIVLSFMMMFTNRADIILVQTPPAIPVLLVVWMVKLLRRSKLIIDWHNYGYTIMSLKMSSNHPLLQFSKWFERYFGRKSDSNLCVTNAMKKDLDNNWNLRNVNVLYDKPAEIYMPIEDVQSVHNIFMKLKNDYKVFKGDTENSTVFTDEKDGDIFYKKTRPAAIISSTSWTDDEDFSILLLALQSYDKKASEIKSLPPIVCIITGKGPQKEYYCNLFKEKPMTYVKFCTPWLSAEDYATILGCCDLGISLHFSSSGLDLPMKVVDMFGCCLPVCSCNFKCIDELVKHEENSIVFNEIEELAGRLVELLRDFPKKEKLNKFRSVLKSVQGFRWHTSWCQTVLPIANELVNLNN